MHTIKSTWKKNLGHFLDQQDTDAKKTVKNREKKKDYNNKNSTV